MPDSTVPDYSPASAAAPDVPKEDAAPSWIARSVGVLNALYITAFLLVMVGLFWWGERHWLLSLLLYAPPYTLLAPLLILTPLCLFVRPRLILWQLLCAAVLCFGYMTFSWSHPSAAQSNPIKVITFNVGQADQHQFQSFVDAEKPDIIVLQDARYGGADYTHMWPDRYVAARGEFLLISRYPIRHADLVEQPSWGSIPIAARFEVLRDNDLFVVYNIHLPTPRPQLNQFLRRRVLGELFSEEDHGKRFASYREWLDARIELARKLANVFSSEKERFIVCGDFNTPDHGYIHRILSRGMADAHTVAGQGWGLTFPGGTKGRAILLGPWLRIDYAYAGRGWRPVYCHTDPGWRSQHRAVAAHFASIP